jgi:MFS family permease
VFVAWKGDTPRRLRLMMASLLAFGATLFLFALSPWFILALPLVLLSDVFASTFNTVNNTAIQLLIPDEVRGRVMSLMMMTFGLTPLGTLPVSAVAQAYGAPFAVALAAVIMIAVSVAFYLLSPALRRSDAAGVAATRREFEGGLALPEAAAAAG